MHFTERFLKTQKIYEYMRILGVDVGIIHLGLIETIVSEYFVSRETLLLPDEVKFCELVDITELVNKCDDKSCELYHDKIICDYMTHLFKMYKTHFDSADFILIERQPLTGLCAIQEIIMLNYRHKSILISPNAMLNFFGLLQYEYEIRKVKTVEIATPYLSQFKQFVFNERKHDLADSLCMIYYYLSMKRKEHTKTIEDSEDKEKFDRVYSKMKAFVYNGD